MQNVINLYQVILKLSHSSEMNSSVAGYYNKTK